MSQVVARVLEHMIFERMPMPWPSDQPTGCLTCSGTGCSAGVSCHCVVTGLRVVEVRSVTLPLLEDMLP